jgi:ribosomal protein S20
MPVTKSAIKKLAQDRKREVANDALRRKLREAVKKTSKKEGSLDKAFAIIDKAAKNKLIHKNKAARLKSALSKIMPSVAKRSTTAKTVKKAVPAKKASAPKKAAPKKVSKKTASK